MVDGSEEPVPSRHDRTEGNIAHRNRRHMEGLHGQDKQNFHREKKIPVLTKRLCKICI